MAAGREWDGRGPGVEPAAEMDSRSGSALVEALSPRERTVALGIARGEAYKVVAIANTLSVQSVSTYLSRAKKKLRVRSRTELIRILSPDSHDGPAPVSPSVDAPGSCSTSTLSASQRNVLEHLLGGLSNAQVAVTLGISPRTVAAHASAVMRKLGVGSRAELIAHILRTERRPAKWIRESAASDDSTCDDGSSSVGKVTMDSLRHDHVLCEHRNRLVVVAGGGVGERTDK